MLRSGDLNVNQFTHSLGRPCVPSSKRQRLEEEIIACARKSSTYRCPRPYNMLSSRGTKKAESLHRPWRYAAAHSYDAETNPSGVISLGMAEHVYRHSQLA